MIQLLELRLIKHPILGDLHLSFIEEGDKQHPQYTTVLIGPNGSGKSYILQAIISIFREAGYYLNKSKSKRSGVMKGSFLLKYKIDKSIVEIANISFLKDSNTGIVPIVKDADQTPLTIKVDGKIFDENMLPRSILASTMIFTDKFPAVSDSNLPQYHYLGLRSINSPSTAGTRAINAKLVNSLIESLEKPGFIDSLKRILGDLKYAPTITVSYIPLYRGLFYNKSLTVEQFSEIFTDWKKGFKGRKSEPRGKHYYHSIEKDKILLEKLVHLLNTIELKSYGRGGKYYEVDLLSKTATSNIFKLFSHLHKLDLVRFPTIQLRKVASNFDFAGSSSGEQNIVFSLLTMLAKMKDKSIVLIDEPELSLHPNWQMQYFSILNEIFKHYKFVHFIVATHSHFLLSDLHGETSKIIGLKRNDNIEVVPLPQQLNTYGWSAEEVLYRIFEVRSSRNSYLEYDLTKLVTLVNRNSNEYEEIARILDKTKRLVLNEGDPLKIIIEKAEKYLRDNYVEYN